MGVITKALSESAFVITATSEVPTTYTTNSVTQVGQQLTHATINNEYKRNVVKMSADGTRIAVGGIGGNNAGIVRVFELANGTWTQNGGDIVGSLVNGYAGTPGHHNNNSISMSADGTLLTTVEQSLGQPGPTNVYVYKYDDSKSTAQLNPALANFGPAKWSRVATVSMPGTYYRSKAAVLSADGKTMVVSDVTLKMYRSEDGGVTWTQRGAAIIDPANGSLSDGPGFSEKISISANGLTVLAATETMSAGGVNAQLLCYEWNGSEWISAVIRTFSYGPNFSVDISADGKVCLFGLSPQGYSNVYRYTKNGSGTWTLNRVVDTVVQPWNTNPLFYSTLALPYELHQQSITVSADGTFLSLCIRNFSSEFGDVEIYRWNGSAYEAVDNNRTIKNRSGDTPYRAFNAMLSSDGTRFVTGGNAKVDVYDLVVTNKTTYSSSNPAVASVYGNLVLMKTTGTSTITASQGGNTKLDLLTVV
jgi:hypothetical protein